MTRSFIQLAMVSLAFLPSILTQQASVGRSYFSPIVSNDAVYILGGSNVTLDVPVLNLTGGLDTTKTTWAKWSSAKSPELTAFTRGVAFINNNNQIYVQAGLGSTYTLESMVNFDISNAHFTNTTTLGKAPPASYLMSATLNPKDNAAYYYGGTTLDNHILGASSVTSNTFTKFDTNHNTWSSLTPATANAIRPERNSHTSNIVNNQMFIMSGITYGANSTTGYVAADFESVLVYDIANNTAVSVTTLGDIPEARQSYSSVLGLDGHSIVIFGGYYYDGKSTDYKPASNDIYILDTCTLTWKKQYVSGTAPGNLFGHGAVVVNDYMIIMMGFTDPNNFNYNVHILDMKQWKWVTSFTNTQTSSVQQQTCQFTLPDITSTNFVEFNYDYGVLNNPLTPPSTNNDKKKEEGLGIGFSLFAILLISVVAYFYIKRRRNQRGGNRALNPRWMRNTTTATSPTAPSDYPLFVYNKELDKENTNNPNRVVNHDVRTYTASDHEQWENNLDQQTTTDIWKRMRGLNDASFVTDEEVQRNHKGGKLLDL